MSARRSLGGGHHGHVHRGRGFWSVRGSDFLDSRGRKVLFSGVTWAGFETPDAVVHGLHVHSLSWHLDYMVQLGFNMLRLPFAGDTLKPGQMPNQGFLSQSPELQGLTSLVVMDKVIEGCAQRGIKVILDYHRMHLTVSNEIGTWFDDSTPESVWIGNWVSLANRYKKNSTVIGADLFNEVHPGCPGCPAGAPFWALNAGANEKYNWRSACVRAIKAVSAVQPNWILFIEGMGNHYWWGGDLSEVFQAPITAPAGKVAYSTHEYGPYVYEQAWFKDRTFPANLVPLWRSKWGFVREQGKGALWVGEFGSFYPPADNPKDREERLSFEALVGYIKQLNSPWTIAFWGPDSKDTGGILLDDWTRPNQEKLNLLKPIMHPNFV